LPKEQKYKIHCQIAGLDIQNLTLGVIEENPTQPNLFYRGPFTFSNKQTAQNVASMLNASCQEAFKFSVVPISE